MVDFSEIVFGIQILLFFLIEKINKLRGILVWFECFSWMLDVEKGCSSHANGCDGTTGI